MAAVANPLMPGATFHDGADDGGAMVGGPARVVWHSTESAPGSMTGVVSWLISKQTAAHLVWDPSTGEVTQLIRGDRAGRALMHPSGTPETNRHGAACIQVEVVGFAAHPFTDGPLVGLEAILSWLETFEIPQNHYSGDRLEWADWASFNGHLGHSAVPGNNHVDPGAIDWTKLLTAGAAVLTPAAHGNPVPLPEPAPAPAPAPVPEPVSNEEDDAMWLLKDPDSDAQYVGINGGWYHIDNPDDLATYKKASVAYATVDETTARNIVAHATVR